MISQETRSMRIFAMATMGLLLVGIAMLSAPAIGSWSVLLAGIAALLLLRAVLLAIMLDRPSQRDRSLSDKHHRHR
ncbi:hypothetical protein [Roseivivax sediminis]|nr:hypothetical protein [Roseivivax sediminis]